MMKVKLHLCPPPGHKGEAKIRIRFHIPRPIYNNECSIIISNVAVHDECPRALLLVRAFTRFRPHYSSDTRSSLDTAARVNRRLQIANCGVKGAEPTRTSSPIRALRDIGWIATRIFDRSSSISLSLRPSKIEIISNILEYLLLREKEIEIVFQSGGRRLERGRIDDRISNGGHFPAVIREPR